MSGFYATIIQDNDCEEIYEEYCIEIPISRAYNELILVSLNEYFEDFVNQTIEIGVYLINGGEGVPPKKIFSGSVAMEGELVKLGETSINDIFKAFHNQKIFVDIRTSSKNTIFNYKIKSPLPVLKNPEDTLWYEFAAANWNEALPIGNGHFGAMIFGDPKHEILQLNEDTIWYGGDERRLNKDAKATIPKVRQLIQEGKLQEAGRLMEMGCYATPPTQHPYQNLQHLHIWFEGDEIKKSPTDYHRTLDIKEGIGTVQFKYGEKRVKREYFTSTPDNVTVMHIEAENPKSISFKCRMERLFKGANSFLNLSTNNGSDQVTVYGQSGPGGVHFRVGMKCLSEDGKISTLGEHLIVKNATKVTLLIAAETTYRHEMKDLTKIVDDLLANAAIKGIKELKKRHLEDHLSLYNRVSLKLGTENSELWKLPTNIRLNRLKAGEDDLNLISMYFQYGRYLLMASSRPGSLPANLQGIWCDLMAPPWGSKYTININTEMNYWPAEVCNLSECHLPLFDHLKRMQKHGEKTAQDMYGCKGWLSHHNTNSWGDTDPVDRWSGAIWPMAGAWLSTHLWEHYLFTKDESFLKENAYGLMKGCVEFFLDYLTEGPEGTWLCGPSVSPENAFITENRVTSHVTMEATMDRQIIFGIFTETKAAAEILGIDVEFQKKIADALKKLPPMKIGQHGQLQEWGEDYLEAEPGHRHMSHLWGLHPGNQISPETTPDLAQATKVTLFRRLSSGGGHTGWSCAWIINFWARLYEPELAYSYVKTILTQSTLSNLFDNHPPFQIDGNFGSTAGIAEMLIQSHQKDIVLLPCLPSSWKSGSITGIMARGGFEFSLEWSNGQLSSAQMLSKAGGPCSIRYQGKVISLETKKNESYPISF